MKYYQDELKRLKNTEHNKTVIVSDGDGQLTKNLGLNEESIPVLIQFLKSELKRLKKINR